MDATAIQQLQTLALAATAVDKLILADQPLALIPEGYKIEDLDKFNLSPSRHKELFRTQYLDELYTYCAANHSDDLSVFIDESNMSATAIFDRSTQDAPRWQDHKAILKLQKTPAYLAILTSNGAKFEQQDLIDFATDWKDHIAFFDSDQALPFNDAITRLRKLKISTSTQVESTRGDFKAAASALEQIAIDAAGAPLPSHFEFKSEPYMQFSERTITGQLRALGTESKAILMYRLQGLPALELELASEFKERIKGNLDGAKIHIGTI